MNIVCIPEHNIRKLRNRITADILLKAVFQEKISFVGRDIPDHNCFISVDLLLDHVKAKGKGCHLFNGIFILSGLKLIP